MQTQGETLYRMYQTILDRSGVGEADKWLEKLDKGQKIKFAQFKNHFVNEDGTIVNRFQLESEA